jgi:hypothetical protein
VSKKKLEEKFCREKFSKKNILRCCFFFVVLHVVLLLHKASPIPLLYNTKTGPKKQSGHNMEKPTALREEGALC